MKWIQTIAAVTLIPLALSGQARAGATALPRASFASADLRLELPATVTSGATSRLGLNQLQVPIERLQWLKSALQTRGLSVDTISYGRAFTTESWTTPGARLELAESGSRAWLTYETGLDALQRLDTDVIKARSACSASRGWGK